SPRTTLINLLGSVCGHTPQHKERNNGSFLPSSYCPNRLTLLQVHACNRFCMKKKPLQAKRLSLPERYVIVLQIYFLPLAR
ncbi:MAG: hypothetical protein NZM34_09530, partial [Bernardetiaceae bacterium]|nr:hypothetical protein [Bernardetiaceae bacterium]